MTGHPIEYDRIFYAWSICLLVTILGQTVGIVTGVVFNVEVHYFLLLLLYLMYQKKNLASNPVIITTLSIIIYSNNK